MTITKTSQTATLKNTLLPLTSDALDTLEKFSACCDVETVVALNCSSETSDSTLKGFYCIFPPMTPITFIPFPVNMFEGVTVVETLASESQILNMIKDKENILEQVREHASVFHSSRIKNRFSWTRCRPERQIPLQRKETWCVVFFSFIFLTKCYTKTICYMTGM
jgi:hypothetical protein